MHKFAVQSTRGESRLQFCCADEEPLKVMAAL